MHHVLKHEQKHQCSHKMERIKLRYVLVLNFGHSPLYRYFFKRPHTEMLKNHCEHSIVSNSL